MLRLLLLPLVAATLLSLLPETAAAECKKKFAYCRFYTSEIEPLYKSNWGGSSEENADWKSKFEYAQLLDNAEHPTYIFRYYQANDLVAQARGNRVPASYSGFEAANVVASEFNRVWNNRGSLTKSNRKAVKRFQKKGELFIRAIDMVYQFQTLDGLPLARVGVRPLNFDYTPDVPLSGYLTMQLFSANDKALRISSRQTLPYTIAMPNLESAKKGELRFGEWQFCEPCARQWMERSQRPLLTDENNSLIQYRENNRMPNYKTLPVSWLKLNVKTSVAKDSVYSGEAAFAAAIALREKERLAKAQKKAEEQRQAALAERYADDRAAYDTYVNEVNAGGLSAFVKKRCGQLKLYRAPNPHDRGSRVEWFEDSAKTNADRYGTHVRCVTDSINQYDYQARALRLKESASKLPMLFAAAQFDDREMATFLTTRKEVDKQQAYLREQEQNYANMRRDFDRAWDEMLDVMAERRERRIVKEVDKCITGLAMTNSLTPGSRSYCRNMAERGYTGLSAAAAGFKGNASGGSGSGGASYQQPVVPEFDLTGMMANAQAVADGADSALLWNKDGTIRTSEAPEVVAFQRQQQAERERLERENERREREERQRYAVAMAEAEERAAAVAQAAARAAGQTEPVAEMLADNTAGASSGSGINIAVTTEIPSAEQMRDLEQGGNGALPPASHSSIAQGGSKVDGGASGRPAGSGVEAAAESPEPEKPKRPVKYVWVEDLVLKHKAWPSSSRESAAKAFEGTLAKNRMNKYCGDTYEGADAYRGIVRVDITSLEVLSSGSAWRGAADINGYCRVFAHHKGYDDIRWCTSDTRGQPDCAVSDRH